MQAVLKSHDAQANRAVLEIGVARLFNSVIVDVDYVVQHAHGGGNGALEFFVVKLTEFVQMRFEVD